MQDRGTCAFCGGVVDYREHLFVTYATKEDAHLHCYEKAKGKLPKKEPPPPRPTKSGRPW
jgi:hypothetical protein